MGVTTQHIVQGYNSELHTQKWWQNPV